MRAIYGFLCRVAKPFVWMVAVLAVSVVSAADQSTSADASNPQDVSQQLHELKQQYEQTTREFQKRIADLEAEINKQNGARRSQRTTPRENRLSRRRQPAQHHRRIRGLVGGVPYQNKTAGISYGVQAETWW
jgi:TolA-binding protein